MEATGRLVELCQINLNNLQFHHDDKLLVNHRLHANTVLLNHKVDVILAVPQEATQ